MQNRRLQFGLANWFWLTLVVAAFFLGRNWDAITRFHHSQASAAGMMFGVGVNSDLGVAGQIVVGDAEFSVSATEASQP